MRQIINILSYHMYTEEKKKKPKERERKNTDQWPSFDRTFTMKGQRNE